MIFFKECKMSKLITEKLDRIAGMIGKLAKDAEKPYDLAGAAEYLSVSQSHLYQLTSKGKIGHYKPAGKRIYFDKADLDEYLRRNRVRPQWEIEQEAANRGGNDG
jgi:excisionase family DNA binding protein